MTDKLQKDIRQVEEAHADAAVNEHLEAHRKAAELRAMFVLGGASIANRIAASLGAESMRAMIRFQEDKLYEPMGYSTFVEFLSESEYAPMTKSQFYERKAILEKEGDVLFDLLTEMGVSIRNRKLLGKGNVQIDGDSAIVTLGDDVVSIELTDRTRLLEVITTVIDAKSDLQKKLDKQAEAIAKHDDKVRELYDEVDRVKASKVAEVGQDPHSIAMVNLNFAYRALIEAVEDMTPIEREQFAPRDFELIAARNADLAAAFGRSDWTKIAPAPAAAKTEGADDIDDLINRALEDDDNDAELAESL